MSRRALHQCLSGVDFARGDFTASQMQNFAYIIGDRQEGICMLVDPSWGPMDLVRLAGNEGMRVTGVLGTHGHADHLGGDLFGSRVPGVRELVHELDCPIYLHADDIEGATRRTGLASGHFRPVVDGEIIELGSVELRVVHSPGHTPGSVCYQADDILFTGDTLFLQGCGRVDFPGSSSQEMFRSLTERLGRLPGHLRVYPGHEYGGSSATLDQVRRTNPYLQIRDLWAWRRLMG